MIDKTWIAPSKTSIHRAKTELVYAVKALENSGYDFKNTINEIKQTIGDLEVALVLIDDAIEEGKI